MSDDRCLCAPGPAGGDPQCVVHRDLYEARSAVRPGLADLLRRFERPRAYAGNYHGDFAERILDLLGYAELLTIVSDLADRDSRGVREQLRIDGPYYCVLCGQVERTFSTRTPEPHSDTCPMRRARELMSTQPPGDDDGE